MKRINYKAPHYDVVFSGLLPRPPS